MEINRAKLTSKYNEELALFDKRTPKSQKLQKDAEGHLLNGVPMNWMTLWPEGKNVFIEKAKGASMTDVDGNVYTDLCIGDTGAMTGHAPDESIDVIYQKMKSAGTATMFPGEDHIWVGKEMYRRFGLEKWNFALSASDANRFCIHWARFATGRDKILIFNHAYHGAVDETLAMIDTDGSVIPRKVTIGTRQDFENTTKVVEFNDFEAFEAALQDRDVALVLCEAALTNVSIVPPAEGFLDHVRKVTKETGTLWLLDETHTISEGIGGYARENGLKPDMLVVGKPIGSGIPCAMYGMNKETAELVESKYPRDVIMDICGVTTTLTGNAVQAAAVRATLEHVLTEENYKHMIAMAQRYEAAVDKAIKDFGLKWNHYRMGARVEFWYNDTMPTTGGQVYDDFHDVELFNYMHLGLMNRGIIIAPFHNMALMCPKTSPEQIDQFENAFRDLIEAIVE